MSSGRKNYQRTCPYSIPQQKPTCLAGPQSSVGPLQSIIAPRSRWDLHPNTAGPLQATFVPRPATRVPLQATRVPLPATSVPRKATSVPLQATIVPRKAKLVPLQATRIPLQATFVPLQATPVPRKANTGPLPAYPFPHCRSSVSAITDGVSAIAIPAAFSAAIFPCAVPFPPLTIAPA